MPRRGHQPAPASQHAWEHNRIIGSLILALKAVREVHSRGTSLTGLGHACLEDAEEQLQIALNQAVRFRVELDGSIKELEK
jgi:hypothetical protein